MKRAWSGDDEMMIHASLEELAILARSLNEVINGEWLNEANFSTLLGASRAECERLLREMLAAHQAVA